MLSFLLFSCGPQSDPNSTDSPQTHLLDSEFIDTYPHIGLVKNRNGAFCTGSLIAPNIVLTAAHCISDPDTLDLKSTCSNNSRKKYYTGNLKLSYTFTIGHLSYVGIHAYSYGSELKENDVAVMVLATPVPSYVATPAPIMNDRPEWGEDVAIIGFGCNKLDLQNRCGKSLYLKSKRSTSSGMKQIVYRKYGDVAYQLCPGDSGGPWFRLSDGAIYGVSSSMRSDLSKNEKINLGKSSSSFGSVRKFYQKIMKRIDADKNLCSIPETNSGSTKYLYGQCQDQNACQDKGGYFETGFCPNHPSSVICCVEDKSKHF